jgi:hypothetical protein
VLGCGDDSFKHPAGRNNARNTWWQRQGTAASIPVHGKWAKSGTLLANNGYFSDTLFGKPRGLALGHKANPHTSAYPVRQAEQIRPEKIPGHTDC